MTVRDPRSGIVLLNVLVLLALSALLVYLMINQTDVAIARGQRFSDASAVQALLRAGEISAVVALRRDMTVAPDIDHPLEAWGRASQKRIDIEGGSFELRIDDARGLFNLNSMPNGGIKAIETLDAIFVGLKLPEEAVQRVSDSIILDGPLRSLDELAARIGLSDDDIRALSPYVTAMPGHGSVNINAAPVDLLAILLGDPALAATLVERRTKAGFLTPDDLNAANVVLPDGLGFTSDLFQVQVTARIGTTEQTVTSLLQRTSGTGGAPEVLIVRRSNSGSEAPPPPT